ncbi:MAG: oligosaccharide flippase family protein [Iodobacter sp.]
MAKNTAWGASASLIATICRMGTGIALARTFSTEINGSYLLFGWFAEFVTLIVCFGSPAALTRFIPIKNQQGDINAVGFILRWVTKRTIVGLLVVVPLFFLLISNISTTNYFSLPTLILSVLLLISQCMNSIAVSSLTGFQKFKNLAFNNLVIGILSFIFQMTGAVFFGLNGALAGFTLSNLVSCYLIFREVNIPSGKKVTDDKYELNKEMNIYAAQSGLAAIVSAVIWSRSEVFFLNQFSTSINAAYFGVSISLVSAINMGVSMLTSALTPHFAEKMAPNASKTLLQRDFTLLTKLTALICIPAAIYSAALMPIVLPLMFGSKYILAVPTAQILILSAGLGFANVGSSLQYASGNSNFILKTSILGTVLMFSGLYLVISDFGSYGAACVRVIVQCIMIYIGTNFNIVNLKVSFPIISILKLSMISFLLSFPIYLMNKNLFLTIIYSLISFVILVFALKRNKYFGRVDTMRVFSVLDRIFGKNIKAKKIIKLVMIN